MYALGYWRGPELALAALALTFIAVLAWRLPGGADGYLRDVTAGVLRLIYLPGMATFVALMLASGNGAHRALVFVILAVCSDTGAYFAGILFGRHPMAPSISPKKTWEGLGWLGSRLPCGRRARDGLPAAQQGLVRPGTRAPPPSPPRPSATWSSR